MLYFGQCEKQCRAGGNVTTRGRLRALRNLLVELAVYGALVTVYAVSVLQLLADPLANLYQENLLIYAWASLFLIVGQGFLLEEATSFLLDRMRLLRFD
jgi:hypothetical protein